MVGDKLKMVFFAIVLSAVVVVVITVCIIFIPARPCIQIDAIEDLQTVQVEDRLLVTWAQPVGQGDCSLIYRIQLSDGTDVIDEVETTETNVEFLNVSIAPCFSSIVSVYAFTFSRFGSNIKGSVNYFNHFGTIGPVTNLQVLQENGALSASWGPPEDSELCSLSYEVTLQAHQEEIQETNVTTETSFIFEQVTTRPCVVKTIVVTPLGLVGQESLRGKEVIHVHFSELGPVENLELEVLGDTSLVIGWNPPLDTEECQLAYQVTLNFQGEFIQDDVIQVNHHSFVIPDAAACGISNISITPIATVSNEEVRGLELHVFHVNELGSVLNLGLSRQANGLLVGWGAPPNTEICGAVTYEVVLQSSGGAIRESESIDENQFVFEQADFTPCTISIITVIPLAMTSGDEFQIRGEANADIYFAGIGAVENLVIAPAEGRLTVNWAPPLAAVDCPLSYEVTLWHDGDVVETTSTDNLRLVFENADVRPCVISEVSVIPVALKDLHEGKGEETRERHIGEIGSVTNFELALDESNQLIARWNAPIDSEVCELVYEILLESSAPVPLQIITESHFEHVFSELVLQPCVLYTVTITPTAAIINGDFQRGQRDTLTYFADIRPVEGLEVNQNGVYLSVNWLPPIQSELCAQVLYEVTLTFGELVLDQDKTGAETHTFVQPNLQPCTENHVSVIPIGSNQDLQTRGPEVSQRHFAAVGPVQNLEFKMEPFGISWSKPVDSSACDLTYQILIESRDTPTATIDNFYPLEDTPCYHYIVTVTPLVQEAQSGAPQTEAHEIPPAVDIGPVRNLRFSDNLFEWDPPINSGVCLVRYDLAMTINGVPFSTQTCDLFFGATPCSTVIIEVSAFVGGHISAPVASELVEVPLLSLGAVENLTFLDDRVQWVKPPDAGDCVIVYELTHTSGSETYLVTLSRTYFLIDLKFCSHHEVTVYAHYVGENEEESISGVATSLQKTVRYPDTEDEIGQVQNLGVNSDGLVEWSPPIGVEMCPVVYLVHVDRIFDQIHHTQDYTQFQIENIPCSNNKLSVNSIVNGVSGIAAEISRVVGPSFDIDAPILVSYIATYNSMSSVWKAPGMTINSCTITHFSVDIEGENANLHNNFRIQVIDNALRQIDLEIGKLFPETDYSITTAIHVLGFPSPGITSEPLLFRTEPAPPGWDDEDTAVDNVKLKSDTPSDSTVSGYKVVIHDNY